MGRDEGLYKICVLKAHLLVLSLGDRLSCEVISITPLHLHIFDIFVLLLCQADRFVYHQMLLALSQTDNHTETTYT